MCKSANYKGKYKYFDWPNFEDFIDFVHSFFTEVEFDIAVSMKIMIKFGQKLLTNCMSPGTDTLNSFHTHYIM